MIGPAARQGASSSQRLAGEILGTLDRHEDGVAFLVPDRSSFSGSIRRFQTSS